MRIIKEKGLFLYWRYKKRLSLLRILALILQAPQFAPEQERGHHDAYGSSEKIEGRVQRAVLPRPEVLAVVALAEAEVAFPEADEDEAAILPHLDERAGGDGQEKADRRRRVEPPAHSILYQEGDHRHRRKERGGEVHEPVPVIVELGCRVEREIADDVEHEDEPGEQRSAGADLMAPPRKLKVVSSELFSHGPKFWLLSPSPKPR